MSAKKEFTTLMTSEIDILAQLDEIRRKKRQNLTGRCPEDMF